MTPDSRITLGHDAMEEPQVNLFDNEVSFANPIHQGIPTGRFVDSIFLVEN
jgi:hypothetical protein